MSGRNKKSPRNITLFRAAFRGLYKKVLCLWEKSAGHAMSGLAKKYFQQAEFHSLLLVSGG
jgi:hypothetical protein